MDSLQTGLITRMLLLIDFFDRKINEHIGFGEGRFCGWPTVLHLSNLGHQVAIVDNLSRRKIYVELECESLTPITRPQLPRIQLLNYRFLKYKIEAVDW